MIGASTVAVPIIVTLADPRGMEPRLLSMKEWIERNSGAVTAVILLMIGVVIIGTGLGHLTPALTGAHAGVCWCAATRQAPSS